jgi:hypothetical protein
MTRTTVLARWSTAAAAAALLAGFAATTAAARPDPGPPRTTQLPSNTQECPLSRVGTQFVRCDNLTGAGVTAPVWIPELNRA